MDKHYSVLMSVYKKERPEYLYAALKSIIGQCMEAFGDCSGLRWSFDQGSGDSPERGSISEPFETCKAGRKCRPWSSASERIAGVYLRVGGTYGQ